VLMQFLEHFVGNPSYSSEKIESFWQGALQRVGSVKALAGDYATIATVTDRVAKAGAPAWAARARVEPVTDTDDVLRGNWRDAWDFAAADAKLAAIDARDQTASLTRERDDADKRCRKLFAELVRERTFYELDRRLSPSVKSALVEFVRAREDRQGYRQGGRTAPPLRS
jgi:hypothetical protein